jgi:flagellar biosynthesis protein FlhF
MNIQRFTGATAREALAKARMAFGEGTLILSNRPTANGCRSDGHRRRQPGDLQRLGARTGAAAPARPRAAAPRQPRPAGHGQRAQQVDRTPSSWP